MYEGEITHTIVMTFKDAAGNIRNIKVPFARANVTGKEVRKVMEYIVAAGVFLSHKGLPLVKLVKATLVTVRMIFSAVKGIPRPKRAAAVQSAVSEVPAGCSTDVQTAASNVPLGYPTNVQSAGSNVPLGCPTTIARLPRATVPSYGISDELFAKANAPCLRPVGADENNLCTTVTDGVKRKIPNNILMFPCQGERDPRQRVRGAFVPSTGFAAGESYPIAKEESHGTAHQSHIAVLCPERTGQAASYLSPLDGKWKYGGDIIRGKPVYYQNIAA